MILVFELVCIATGHTAINSAMIQTTALAFPDQAVRVFAHESHLRELRADPALWRCRNLSFKAVPLSPHFRLRPNVVSLRRGLRELWTLLNGLWSTPGDEPALLLLISATPTAIFAAALLSMLTRRHVRVQVALHGNLNDGFRWRARNPLIRMFDLRAALTKHHGGRVRLLLLEDAIRRALLRIEPAAAKIVDVLPHPISPTEVDSAEANEITAPLRIGMVGQATEAKGIKPFLALAEHFAITMPSKVSFHLVGNAPKGSEIAEFAPLNEPVPTQHISRAEFLVKIQRLHYICLLLHRNYYELSASGALMDALVWLRPIIATPIPMVVDLFDQFGDIGELCDDSEGVRAAITRLARFPDPERYNRQIANLRRARATRMPASQACEYQRIIRSGFPGLLGPHQGVAATVSTGKC